MRLRSTSLGFVEEGPDNVGGRTRAIAMDPNNNIFYLQDLFLVVYSNLLMVDLIGAEYKNLMMKW